MKTFFFLYTVASSTIIFFYSAAKAHGEKKNYRKIAGWWSGVLLTTILIYLTAEDIAPIYPINDLRIIANQLIQLNLLLLIIVVILTIIVLKVMEKLTIADKFWALIYLLISGSTSFSVYAVLSLHSYIPYIFTTNLAIVFGLLLFIAFFKTKVESIG